MRNATIFVSGVLLLGLVGLLGVTSLANPGQKKSSETAELPKEPITAILSDQQFWGKNLPVALVSFPAWNENKEHSVALYPHRVVGMTPYKDPEAAEQVARQLREVMTKNPGSWKPAFADLFKEVPRPLLEGGRVYTIAFFPDDGSARVAFESPKSVFFSSDLRIEQVHSRFGKPEKVSKKVYRNEHGERRPVILTLHSYAKGAIQFAESDINPKPGSVDRVILEVPTIRSAVFTEGR